MFAKRGTRIPESHCSLKARVHADVEDTVYQNVLTRSFVNKMFEVSTFFFGVLTGCFVSQREVMYLDDRGRVWTVYFDRPT